MNKKILFLPILIIGLNTACSTKNSTEKLTTTQHTAEIKNVPAKPKKHRHHTLPEGVISADIVSYDNRLHLLTGKNKQGQKSLWYQYSTDGGNSWSAEIKILNDNIPAKMVRGNDAQIAAQGKNIVVTWTKFDKNSRFSAGAMLAARSSDGGQTWQYADTPPDWKQGPHGYIDMTADNHAFHAVWLDSRNGHADVKASQGLHYARSTDGGLSWQTNNTLDKLTCSCCWNTLKTNAEGNAYVLYRDKQPSDLSIGVINKKQKWQRLNHVGAFNWQFEGCPHIGGGLDFQTTAGKNRQHAVVGTGHQQHLGIHYLYSDDAGNNWSAPKQLGDESAIHADVAAHDNGRVVAVWDMMGEEGLAIFTAESKDQGKNWSASKQISKTGLRATHPRIVKTEKGFLSLWTENNGHIQTIATKIH